MTAEAKIRTLASADATLQSFFLDSTGVFRWFDRQLDPGFVGPNKTCVRVRRVSTVHIHSHETQTASSSNSMQQPRFQIDVLDMSAETARAAAAAVADWFHTVDFSTDDQFGSPPLAPKGHPNYVINQRADMEYTTQPPAYVEILDVRVFNLEE